MLKVRLSLLATLTLSGVMLLAAATVRAQATVTPAFNATRMCTLPIGNKGVTVNILAGPNGTGGLANGFPKQVPCPDGNDTCLEWEYQWIYNGGNPSHTLLTAHSDLEIITRASDGTFNINPPASSDPTYKIGSSIYDVRTIRINNNASNFTSRYFTRKAGVGIGVITAGARSGTDAGFCGINGPTSIGATPDNFTPNAIAECKQSGPFSFSLFRGKDSCVQQLFAFTNNTCDGVGQEITGEALAENIKNLSPLNDFNACQEVLTVTANSPCDFYQTKSGGKTYKWCYHLGSLIATDNCVNHVNQCATGATDP